MTLEKAIKELERISECQDEDWLDFEYASLKLGIEALKVFAEYRYATDTDVLELLPGETEE